MNPPIIANSEITPTIIIDGRSSIFAFKISFIILLSIYSLVLVNGVGIIFDDIIDFRVQEKKPQVIFFINNKMIVFKECTFRLKLKTEELSFNVIGSEKIKLLKEFLELKIKRKQEL